MKKLIPALCLLLISAAMLGTSTFAWFSMNTTVTAETVTVKAVATKNLLISDAAAGTYTASLALTTNIDTLVPCSTAANNALPTFYRLNAAGHGMDPDSYATAFDSTFVAATEDTHYVRETMYIKSVGSASTNLIATISYTGGAEELDPALRVLIVVNEANTFYYAPVTGASAWKGIASISAAEAKTAVAANMGATSDVKAIDGITYYEDSECTEATSPAPAAGDDVTGKYFILPAGIKTLSASNISTSTSGSTVIVGTVEADTAYKIDVYFWYEGEDTNCKATNTVDLDTTTFTVKFSAS